MRKKSKIWEYVETDRLVRKAGKTFTTWRPWLSIKASANLAGLLALPCRIAEFSCVPPHNEEEKTVDPDELSTTNTKLLNNYFWQMVMYLSTLSIITIMIQVRCRLQKVDLQRRSQCWAIQSCPTPWTMIRGMCCPAARAIPGQSLRRGDSHRPISTYYIYILYKYPPSLSLSLYLSISLSIYPSIHPSI